MRFWTLVSLLTIGNYCNSQLNVPCNNWLGLPSYQSYARVGDLDIPGNQISVEALFVRTAPYTGGFNWAGDLVSKHVDPGDVNYLLRPNNAEITTTSGFFTTPPICEIELNKTYHAAMVYDGVTLKFYRNGFLMSSVAATGNLIQNNHQTRIGLYDALVHNTNLIGYINEVRIWNVVRSQSQIRSFMNGSLPNPATQTGLLAYYTFDNLLNKQGNIAWNGSLGGTASINQTNPNCSFSIDSCGTILTPNCSTVQFGIGGPGFDRAIDVAATTANEFYAVGISRSFTSNDDLLVCRLTATGNVIWSKVIGNGAAESVRKITPTSDGGLLITGQTKSFSNPNGDILCMKLSSNGTILWSRKFGVGSPSGDLGMDIIETTDGGYAVSGILDVNGFVADAVIIKLDNSANVAWSKQYDRGIGEDGVGILQKGDTLIAAADLENLGSHYELLLMKIKLIDGSFIMSKKLTPASRGLFNPYLFKNPTGPGYFISGHTIDNASYANMNHTVITVDDNFNVLKTQLISLAAITNDFFTGFIPLPDGSFIGTATPQTNADGYIYRIGSNNSIVYSKRFNATNDRRLYRSVLGGQKVMAVGGLVQNGQEDFFVTSFDVNGMPDAPCDIEDITMSVQQPIYNASTFNWPDITDVSFSVTTATLNSSNVVVQKTDLCPNTFVNTNADIFECPGIPVQLNATGAFTYSWSPATGLNDPNIANPIANPAVTTQYIVTGTTVNGCIGKDSVVINLLPRPTITKSADTTICSGTSAQIFASGGSSYSWTPGASLNSSTIPNPIATPLSSTTYFVTVTGSNSCTNTDSVKVSIRPMASFSINGPLSVCVNNSVQLNASGGHVYIWNPASSLNNSAISNPIATPVATTTYFVVITDTVCNSSSTLSTVVTVDPLPAINASKSNDLDCSMDQSQLGATGGAAYTWSPSATLNNSGIANPIAKPLVNTTYTVTGSSAAGCINQDTITVNVTKNNAGGYFMASAFTPNNDGLNDCFGFKYWGQIEKLEFSIYNRWGERIFFSKTPGQCWDGKYKGTDQPPGVYVFMIRANTACEKGVFRKGIFTLIR